MLFKKKKTCTNQEIIVAAILKALGIYSLVLGIRLQFSSYKIFVLDALIVYLIAVLLFGLGKHMHNCCRK